jgi:hypothetical protein
VLLPGSVGSDLHRDTIKKASWPRTPAGTQHAPVAPGRWRLTPIRYAPSLSDGAARQFVARQTNRCADAARIAENCLFYRQTELNIPWNNILISIKMQRIFA